MNENLNHELKGSSTRGWLASLMLQRGGEVMPRFVLYYRELARRPRAWRRKLRRQLAVTISGAALLLALAGPVGPATANPDATLAVIEVVDGEVADVDNGQCSLIEALINARATWAGSLRDDCAAGNLEGADTVVLPSGGYFELKEIHNEIYGPTGLPLIKNQVTIEGNGATITRSYNTEYPWTPDFRILAVSPSGDLTLLNASISNGHAYGGGGGILSLGALQVSNSFIYDNRAYQGFGGGIFAAGKSTITGSTIEGNNSNGSGSSGGGIYIGQNADATISGSLILDNTIGSYWHAIGGGIGVQGKAVIVDSLIQGNINFGSEGLGHGGQGGGIGVLQDGVVTIIGSTISGNEAKPDSGPYESWFEGLGGGLSNLGQTVIANTTISGNKATIGGGVSNSVYGDMEIIHSTITGNVAEVITGEYNGYEYKLGGFGGGIYSADVHGEDKCSSTALSVTLVSGNIAGGEVLSGQIYFNNEMDNGQGCMPSFTVNAFNVLGQDGKAGLVGLSPGATDVVPSVGLSSILGPLADNGGPTQTHALVPGSPALDIAPNASCAAEPVNGVDQRGEPRNRNGTGGLTANECDAGSFELYVEPTIYLPFTVSPTSVD